ncbi:MAG: UbiA-like polyprenyltransferase [Candidatus Eremiobacterota bacterium]
MTLWKRFVELVRFEQTLFALPFAYAGMLLAAGGWPGLSVFGWVTLAMVGARTGGMCANRLIDAEIDARNPRTADRPLPTGRISRRTVALLMAASLSLLCFAAGQLNATCALLSPVAVCLLVGYSYLKRVTWACHLGLGLVQACAPIGGWLAVSGSFAPGPLWLGAAIFLWVAGFDVLYACQDIEIDRRDGLHSLPARIGPERAFRVSRLFHVGTVLSLGMAGATLGLGLPYYAGVGLIGAMLVYEHQLLKPDDLGKMQQAFFVANAFVSVTFLVSILLEVFGP